MKKILIIEDDKEIAVQLEEILNTSGYNAIILKDFKNSKEEIIKINPDLILLDINIPYMNGEQLLKEIRKQSTVPIIMVTSKNSETDEVLSMSYGADDYITKPYNPTILLLRIENIFKRMNSNNSKFTYKDIEVNISKGVLRQKEQEIILTKNEMIIFEFLLINKDKIVTRDELMTALWDNNEFINDNALTVNISRLRSKLSSLGYYNAIETRKKQGYILLWN